VPVRRAATTHRVAITRGVAITHRAAFTLIEMMVVVAVILIILGLALPAASSLWEERKTAETVNTIQGLLMTSRAQAMQADAVETGFLAYVDSQGTQHLVSIEQRRDKLSDPNPRWSDVFVIGEYPVPDGEEGLVSGGADHTIPAPRRVIPRYAVELNPAGGTTASPDYFEDDELNNDDFVDPPGDQAQRHRNFFTMIFSTDGQLQVGRNVLIQDINRISQVDTDATPRGDRTGLPVSPEAPKSFYDAEDNELDLDFVSDDKFARNFIVGKAEDDKAVNFPSVDGLLVYDESLYSGLTVGEKRDFLIETAQPLYVSRWTGTLIVGPVGEPPPP